MGDESTFTIMLLCTGNRARSAMAEAFIREMTEGLPVEVASAGLLELEAGPALPEAVAASQRVGIDLSAHRSRPLSQTTLEKTDLVLGFERQHLATAVVDAQAPAQNSFLFREFLRLMDQLPPSQPDDSVAQQAKRQVAVAHSLRNGVTTFFPEDEIEDPYGQSIAAFDRLSTDLYRSCARLVYVLFGRYVEVPELTSDGSGNRNRGRLRTMFRREGRTE